MLYITRRMVSGGFYSEEELKRLGLKCIGSNVLISRETSFYSGDGITIGDHVRIDDFCVIVGNISIGSHVHIGSHCSLHASGEGKIVFEDYSGISSNVHIYASSDDFDGEYMTWRPGIADSLYKSKYSQIVLAKYSQIGTSSVVIPGGNLAEGTAVGAMSLIRTNLLPWSVYAGIPCKKIKERKKNVLTIMDSLKERE